MNINLVELFCIGAIICAIVALVKPNWPEAAVGVLLVAVAVIIRCRMAIVGLMTLLLVGSAVAQTNPPGPIGAIGNSLSNFTAQVNESATNLFQPGEIDIRVGALYVQQTQEAAELLALEKWDVFAKDVAIGAETIETGTKNAAEFAYVAYRKTKGNGAIIGAIGGGYSQIDKKPLGVLSLRLEYAISKSYRTGISTSYGFEPNAKNSRGMISGAYVSYVW